jgi:hypothetical protein
LVRVLFDADIDTEILLVSLKKLIKQTARNSFWEQDLQLYLYHLIVCDSEEMARFLLSILPKLVKQKNFDANAIDLLSTVQIRKPAIFLLNFLKLLSHLSPSAL